MIDYVHFEAKKKISLYQRLVKLLKPFFILLFLGFLSFLAFTYFFGGGEKYLNPLGKIEGAIFVKKADAKRKPDPISKTALLEKLKNDLSINQTYAVSVYDISTGDEFGINEDTPLEAASEMKLLTGIMAFQEVETGQHSFGEPLGDYTYSWQLQQLLNQSNNDSWDFFNNMFSFSAQQDFADKNGLTEIEVVGNKMTAHAAANIFLKLYQGKLLNNNDRDTLYSYLQNTELEDRISAGLPAGTTFYHKEGSLEQTMNDVALIEHPKEPFILAIFTNDDGSDSVSDRTSSFQNATRDVWNYFDAL